MTWLSFHIFCHDTQKHDELIGKISTYLTNLIPTGVIDKWFYIRYWIGGPHIRVRIEKGKAFSKEDYDKLYDFLERINQENMIFQLDEEKYYSVNKAGLNETTIEESEYPWYKSGTVEEIEYIPETDRYGGEKSMSLSEEGFYISSNLTSKFLYVNFSNRILLSGTVMRNILQQLFEKSETNLSLSIAKENWNRTFSIKQNNDYLETIKKIISKINLSKTTEILEGYAEINEYVSLLNRIRDEVNDKDYFTSVLFSHFHMLNNRIGISPEIEAYIFESLIEEKELIS